MPVADEVVMELGYPAVLSRMAITARTPVPALKVGNLFLGLIPKALKIPKLGWVSDIISWRDLSVKMTQPQIDQVSFLLLGKILCSCFYLKICYSESRVLN